MNSNARERALGIIELLDNILNHLKRPDLASCARVCRLWETPSLRILWRGSTPNDGDLLRILGELKVSDGPIVGLICLLFSTSHFDQDQNFARTPGFENWERFHRYASLIRTNYLSFQEAERPCEQTPLSPRTVQQIRVLAEAKRVPVFPNLLHLELCPLDQNSCEACIFLIPDGLRVLELSWGNCQWISMLPHLQRARFCTDLTRLEIYFNESAPEEHIAPFAAGIVQLLDSLTKLETVTIPNWVALYSSVWRALQDLASLRSIVCDDLAAVGEDASSEHLELGRGFERLAYLECFPLFPQAIRLLTPVQPNAKITELLLHIYEATGPLESVLSAISRGFPRAESVSITFAECHVPLRLGDITPLSQLPRLRYLTISTDVMPDLSNDEYGLLAQSFPKLQSLRITPNPSIYTRPSATLLALSNIAAHCRDIQNVTIPVDTTIDALPAHHTVLHPFSASLQVLSFGPCEAQQPLETAFRLARMLIWCDAAIQVGIPLDDDLSEESELSRLYGVAMRDWAEVARVLDGMRPSFEAIKKGQREEH